MTTWNDTTTIETGWSAGENTVQRPVLYNAEVGYNVDYLTYDGAYIQNEIDWNQQSVLETAWSEL